MRSVCQGAKTFHTEEQTARRTDIQIGMTKLIVAFCYFFAKAPNKWKIHYHIRTAHNGSCPESHALRPLPHTVFL